jgi:hypothetical protein
LVTGITTGIEHKKREPCEGKGKLLTTGSGTGQESGSATGALAGAAIEPTRWSSWGKGRRDDAAGLADGEEAVPTMGSDNAAAIVMDAEVVVARKLLEGGMKAGNDGWAPSGSGRQMSEQSRSSRIGSISGGPSGRRWKWGSSQSQTPGDMGGGSSGVHRVLKEHGNRVGAKEEAESGRQAAT